MSPIETGRRIVPSTCRPKCRTFAPRSEPKPASRIRRRDSLAKEDPSVPTPGRLVGEKACSCERFPGLTRRDAHAPACLPRWEQAHGLPSRMSTDESRRSYGN